MSGNKEYINQAEHIEYTREQTDKIQRVKSTMFCGAARYIEQLKSEPAAQPLLRYIQWLEMLNIGTWCDTCAKTKRVHEPASVATQSMAGDLAAETVAPRRLKKRELETPTRIDIKQDSLAELRADVASLKAITAQLNTRVGIIEDIIDSMQKNSSCVSADALLE